MSGEHWPARRWLEIAALTQLPALVSALAVTPLWAEKIRTDAGSLSSHGLAFDLALRILGVYAALSAAAQLIASWYAHSLTPAVFVTAPLFGLLTALIVLPVFYILLWVVIRFALNDVER
jgi:hypothetical protein